MGSPASERRDDGGDGHDVPLVLIGGSAGAVAALVDLVRAVPDTLDAAILVVLHTPPEGRSRLTEILARQTSIPVIRAQDDEPIAPRTIAVARPDRHLLVEDGRMRVIHGPHENLYRPAVDPLFRSAASSGPRPLVAIVLSGALDDGTAGARAIRDAGGVVVIQDPDEAVIDAMPSSVLASMPVDRSLPAREIGEQLAELVELARSRIGRRLDDGQQDGREASMTTAHGIDGERPAGSPSGFTCPECGGGLWMTGDATAPRFECRTGHAFTARALVAAQDLALEEALWAALRALEEQADLSHRLAARSDAIGAPRTFERYRERAERATQRAAVLRRFLVTEPRDDEPEPGDAGARAEDEREAAAGA